MRARAMRSSDGLQIGCASVTMVPHRPPVLPSDTAGPAARSTNRDDRGKRDAAHRWAWVARARGVPRRFERRQSPGDRALQRLAPPETGRAALEPVARVRRREQAATCVEVEALGLLRHED